MAKTGQFCAIPPAVFLSRYIALFMAFSSYSAEAGLRAWLFGQASAQSCSNAVIHRLYTDGQHNYFKSEREFQKWLQRLPKFHGLSAEQIEEKYAFLNDHVELLQLMRGFKVASGSGESEISVAGGWGQDFMFVPTFPLWQSVHENFAPLIRRMGDKLKLHPILRSEMFRSDHISIPDSGWVIVEWQEQGEVKKASVKITFFDRTMTPDGPFPRFAFDSPLNDGAFLLYRAPERLPGYMAGMALEGHYSLRSSLDYWGLLPFEVQTRTYIPEHQQENYPPEYAGLFEESFRLQHKVLMASVVNAFHKKQVGSALEALNLFRYRRLPEKATQVAEIGRFNIPPGAPPAVLTYLYYGVSVLLTTRPISSLYLLVPRPERSDGRQTGPAWQVFHQAPGWGWLADIARRVAMEHEAEPPLEDEPEQRDLLLQRYEQLGFKVIGKWQYLFGLPNGAHAMYCSRENFLKRLAFFKFHRDSHLQRAHLGIIRERIERLEHP